MKNLFVWLFWFALFVVLLVGVDRYLMGTRSDAPVVSEVQEFYQDFRQRLVGLFAGGEEQSVSKVIERTEKPVRKDSAAPAGGEPKFLYVDSGGKLHFATSLEEVPPPYRAEAQPLEQ